MKEGSKMEKQEKVVVVLPMRYLVNAKKDMYAARIRDLGLTAYGSTKEEAKQKVKRMFAAYVAAHRKRGTLKKRLDESKLDWCWLKDWEGDVESVTPEGLTEILHCSAKREVGWVVMGEVAVAV
jgi:hypothetical protein